MLPKGDQINGGVRVCARAIDGIGANSCYLFSFRGMHNYNVMPFSTKIHAKMKIRSAQYFFPPRSKRSAQKRALITYLLSLAYYYNYLDCTVNTGRHSKNFGSILYKKFYLVTGNTMEVFF